MLLAVAEEARWVQMQAGALAPDAALTVLALLDARMDEVYSADEVWITSSSKDIAAVVQINGTTVGNGEVGDVWLAAQTLYSAGKFNY